MDQDTLVRECGEGNFSGAGDTVAGSIRFCRIVIRSPAITMKILIVSDIHANRPALHAVLTAEPDADAILCLGDLVNYGPDPVECVRWARRETAPLWIVQGNHDRAFGCNEDPRCSGPYRPLAEAMQRITAPKLSADAKRYLAGLPRTMDITFEHAKFFLCHATPGDPLYAYLPPDAEPDKWEKEIATAGAPDFLLVGHTHLPFIRAFGQTVVVNPGSVGQPKTDDRRACYAVWEHHDVTLRRVDYDVASVARHLSAIAPVLIAEQLTHVLLTGGEPAPVASG